MTILFVAIVLAVFLGGVCLWLSGMLFGRRGRAAAPQIDPAAEQLRAERARLDDALLAANARLAEAEARAATAEQQRGKAQEDVARSAAELDRVAGAMDDAEQEMGRLKAEVEALKAEKDDAKAQHRLKPPPLPVRGGAVERHEGGHESPALDHALAQLDMERVAHKKTREELDQLKKGGPVQISDGRPSVPPLPSGFGVPGRRGAGFQTVSIAARSQPVAPAEHDRLRQSHDQLQREKERVEAELARAQQELQLLRMRGE